MADDAGTGSTTSGCAGRTARLLSRLVATILSLAGVVAVVGVGTYVWSNWAAARERAEAERRFERLERLDVFEVPVGGVDEGWSRTWPDEHEIHLLSSEEGASFTALSRDRRAVPMPPVAVVHAYADVLERGAWQDVSVTCSRGSLGGSLRAEVRAWRELDGERVAAVVQAGEERGGAAVEVTAVVHGDQVGLYDPRPCPGPAG